MTGEEYTANKIRYEILQKSIPVYDITMEDLVKNA